MFKTLKNAWGIIDLKKKMLFTLFIVVLYRLGAQVPVPFIDAAQLSGFQEMMNGGIFQYLNIISGQALGNATLFALGVSPYITASIVVQLLTIAIPALEKWAKEGEEGKKKINVLTRIVTVALALITSIGYVMMLRNNGGSSSLFNFGSQVTHEAIYGFAYVIVVLCYCAGAAIVMWLAEKINESGIGNGISIILFANIIAGFGTTAAAVWGIIFKNGGFKGFDWVGLLVAIGFVVLAIAMLVIIVWMSDAERRIPIQYAKRVVGRKMYGGQNTNLPLKVNMTGVMPIIFANSIVTIPATIAMLTKNASWTWVDKATLWCIRLFNPEYSFKSGTGENIADDIKKVNDWLVKFTEDWLGNTSFIYLAVFAVLLVAFAYFYVAISFNPVEVANNIKNNGGMIPGIRSGRPTIDFIKKVLYRVTLIGALIVVLIACSPMLVTDILGIEAIKKAIETARGVDYSAVFATLAFSGSSLMIVVGVALETVRELEAQMSLRNYKGFLD